MTCKECGTSCRRPISHAQPTIENINLPSFAVKVGDKDPAQFNAQDRRAMNLFKP
jgi:hypothetical protein